MSRETLEERIIREALPGFSVARDLPGGFVAYVAKLDNGKSHVEYVHANTHPGVHRVTQNRVRNLALGNVEL